MNQSKTRERPPNFIVIYADDLGFGDIGGYGGTGIPTPRLDGMIKEGLRFTNCYATAATCTPSRYSILTGSYPWRNPKAHILRGDAPMIIGPDELTLPTVLKRAGYATSVVGKWHLGLGEGTIDWNGDIRPGPLDVGFDESFFMAATNDRVPTVYIDGRRVHNLDPQDPLEVVYGGENPFPEVPTGRSHPERLTMRHSDQQHWDTIINGVPRIGYMRGGAAAVWDDTTMNDVFLERAKSFIERKKDAPFFLYLSMHQPHAPRIASTRFQGATDQGPRGDVIAELDWTVGEVLDHLKALGIDENTVVIFSSDNGPILDDGYLDDSDKLIGDHRPAGPLRGGKYSLFDGGARVPTIVWAPGRVAAGTTSEALLSQVDWLPSLARLAGKPLPPEAWADGLELSDALLGRTGVGRDHLVTEGIGGKTVVREGDWVYLPSYPGNPLFGHKKVETGYSDVVQLYDLSADIGQRRNLASEKPEKVEALSALLAQIKSGQSPQDG